MNTDMSRSASLSVLSRHKPFTSSLVALKTNLEVDLHPDTGGSSSSTPTGVAKGTCQAIKNWKTRQAASIDLCLKRQQKNKMKAALEKERRDKGARIACMKSLASCTNPELKAFALAHVPLTHKSYTPTTMSAQRPAHCHDVFDHRLCGFIPTEGDFGPILSMLPLKPDDVFYDLGCGDGRVVIEVVKHFRCKGIGVDVNRLLINKARASAKAKFSDDAELLERCRWIEEDISRVDLSNASVVYIYMPNSSLHTLMMSVLPHCDLQDGTTICVKDNWIRDGEASRNCKHTASHWGSGIHCYTWEKDVGKSHARSCGHSRSCTPHE